LKIYRIKAGGSSSYSSVANTTNRNSCSIMNAKV